MISNLSNVFGNLRNSILLLNQSFAFALDFIIHLVLKLLHLFRLFVLI